MARTFEITTRRQARPTIRRVVRKSAAALGRWCRPPGTPRARPSSPLVSRLFWGYTGRSGQLGGGPRGRPIEERTHRSQPWLRGPTLGTILDVKPPGTGPIYHSAASVPPAPCSVGSAVTDDDPANESVLAIFPQTFSYPAGGPPGVQVDYGLAATKLIEGWRTFGVSHRLGDPKSICALREATWSVAADSGAGPNQRATVQPDFAAVTDPTLAGLLASGEGWLDHPPTSFSGVLECMAP